MSWLSLFLVTVLVSGIVVADPSVDDSNQEQVATDEVDAEGRGCKGSCGSSGHYKDPISIKPTISGDGLNHYGYGDGLGGYGDLGGLGGLSGLLGLGGATKGVLGQGLIMIPLLAVNIAILVLLGILVGYAHTFADGFGGTGGTGGTFVSTAPGFGGTAPGFGGTAPGFGGTAPGFGGIAPGFGGTAPGFGGTTTGFVSTGPGVGGGIGSGGTSGGFGNGIGRGIGSSPLVSSYQGYDSGAYHKRSMEEARSMESPSMLSYLTKMATNAIIKYTEIDQDEE